MKASRNKTVRALIRNYPACGQYDNVCWDVTQREIVESILPFLSWLKNVVCV